MAQVSEIIKRVDFDPAFPVDALRYNEQYGFLQLDEGSLATDAIKFVGFGAPRSRSGGFDLEAREEPIVDLADLHPSAQKAGIQAKGVGFRAYNTPPASQALTDVPKVQGAYVFELRPEAIRDRRRAEGDTFTRIGRHADRLAGSQRTSLADVVEDVHASYGNADAVLYTQPPRAQIRQFFQRLSPDVVGVPGEFMIVRSPLVRPTKVGEYARRRWQRR